jgi:hypothetical protein
MFEHWDSFYLLVGGASGGLIGLLFVVATLTRGRDRDSALFGASIYMSPVVMHLAFVLAISAVAAVPGVHMATAAAVIGLCGLVGVACSGRVIYHLAFVKTFAGAHWTDLWCYGVAGLGTDLLLAGSALAVVFADADLAARLVATSVVLILLLAIRNAWDLVTWISAIQNTGGTLPATANADEANPPPA